MEILDTEEKERAVDAIIEEHKARESRREKQPEPQVKVMSLEARNRLSDLLNEKLYKEEDLL